MGHTSVNFAWKAGASTVSQRGSVVSGSNSATGILGAGEAEAGAAEAAGEAELAGAADGIAGDVDGTGDGDCAATPPVAAMTTASAAPTRASGRARRLGSITRNLLLVKDPRRSHQSATRGSRWRGTEAVERIRGTHVVRTLRVRAASVAWHAMTSSAGPDSDTSDRGVALLIAVAAVVVAFITLVAVRVSGDASSSWQSALRQEVARGAAAVEDIRYVYGVEAPAAFQVAIGEVQAEEYRVAAGSSAAPEIRSRLEARAQVLDMAVGVIKPSIEMATQAYALSSGGYDTLKRLSEQLADPERVPRDPDGAMATGDEAAARSVRLVNSIVAVAFAFLFGALAQAFRRPRRVLLACGWVALGGGLAVALAGGLLP